MKVTEENVLFFLQAFKNHPLNAKSVIKQKYNITDIEFNQLKSDYEFNGFKEVLKVKKPKKHFKIKKEIKLLRCFIDNENKSVSIPHNVDLNEDLISKLEKLKSIGFTCQRSTF